MQVIKNKFPLKVKISVQVTFFFSFLFNFFVFFKFRKINKITKGRKTKERKKKGDKPLFLLFECSYYKTATSLRQTWMVSKVSPWGHLLKCWMEIYSESKHPVHEYFLDAIYLFIFEDLIIALPLI